MDTPINLSAVGKMAPPRPSKWDIIPIHTSDRATFKGCRRAWGWSSPSRDNLIPKTRVNGIREPFWFGTGIHYALERYYHPMLKEDPVITWETWFNLQWNGGLVTEEEIAEHGFYDREPVRAQGTVNIGGLNFTPEMQSDPYYFVKGLNELLPDPDEEHFMELKDLGRGMMEFYKKYAEREDNFTIISVEHNFSIPILTNTGGPMYMVDTRTMPDDYEYLDPEGGIPENEYGPLWYYKPTLLDPSKFVVFKQVHARGRMDCIIQDNESGRYGIIDHKTASSINDDYFRHIDLDEQVTTYMWAAEREAQMYDLEYKQLDFVIYQALLKGYPKPPTLTSRGLPSIDRQKETTTAQMFEDCIRSIGMQEYFDADIKMQSYYTWLLETGDKRFVHRHETHRNKAQKANLGTRIYYEAMDMLSDPILYHNPRKEYSCLNCVFRQPCIAVEDGSDYEMMLKDGFMPNWDR